ncbi:hypothetical protein RHSP_82270 [Rhizobium freirei PRF 81]|uniref:Major facilitator superfamily (MFS) profile domain-containing protein n=3 Tax=Rhizobium TaxID=379 RepID=N6U337_9HYPH|nr:hypothetical protein RHSP_82270 [Rhizobium freirei PRF 81]TGE92795.1 MFS transporter [Rhizobium sp. SEMIA 4088]SCB49539.1 Major Facilitator Superfamily protein [Rhizobium lusitanum]
MKSGHTRTDESIGQSWWKRDRASAGQSSAVGGMNRILVLTTAVFITGLAENVFIGVLPNVAGSLGVGESEASILISVFSVTYAFFAPIATLISYRFDVKPTLLAAMSIFAGSNVPVVIGGSGLLPISASRIITAMACAQISVCAVGCAVQIVSERYRARAIASVYLGISGSLFLGVPLGVWITHLIGWRRRRPCNDWPICRRYMACNRRATECRVAEQALAFWQTVSSSFPGSQSDDGAACFYFVHCRSFHPLQLFDLLRREQGVLRATLGGLSLRRFRVVGHGGGRAGRYSF